MGLTHPALGQELKLTFMDYLLTMLRNLLRRKLSYDIRAILDRISTPSLCVLAGAVGHPCIVFGSVVRWMLAALHSCLVLMLDLCA